MPKVSAAAAILQDSTTPHVYLGGEQYLLDWPQLEGKVGSILSLLNDEEEAARLIQYQQSYQAAAKVLQVAQSLFDTLLQTAGG